MAAQDADEAHLQPTEIVEAENQNSEETPRTPTLPLRERETRLWATIEIKCPNPSLEALNAAFRGSRDLEPLDFDELEAHAALVFAGAKLAYERAQEVRNNRRRMKHLTQRKISSTPSLDQRRRTGTLRTQARTRSRSQTFLTRTRPRSFAGTATRRVTSRESVHDPATLPKSKGEWIKPDANGDFRWGRDQPTPITAGRFLY